MNANVLLGLLLIATGAFTSGSFSVPLLKVKGWKWENSWLAFSLFAYIIVPLLLCLIFSPGFMKVYASVSTEKLLWILFLGFVYGIANVTFGLSLRYLGLSLGYALSLGLMMAIGTLVPPILDGKLSGLFQSKNGSLLIAGVIVSLIGIAISAHAGIQRDKTKEKEAGSEFNLPKGLLFALIVGIFGAALSLGISEGKPLADQAIASGTNPLFQDSPVFLLIFSGSFVSTFIWCMVMAKQNKSMAGFVKTENNTLSTNYFFAGLSGFLWFINFFFFGMGKNRMGDITYTAWGILMTLTIVCATLWGLYRGEWKGVSKKIHFEMWLGLIILIAAAFMIGISGS
ncbi:MAG: L-rhamnose/proton symporter RhaT [Chitinophagaceae bacterium]